MMRPQYLQRCFQNNIVLLLLAVTFSTREFHRKMHDRGVSSSLPSKMMSSIEKFQLVPNSHQMLLIALSAALTVATPAASRATEESEYLESLLQNTDTDICIFSPGYKIELEQYRNIAYKEFPYTRSIILATADDGDSSNFSLNCDAEAVLSEVKRLAIVGHTTKEKDSLGFPLLLMGHSRGGAVATLAATMHLNAVVRNTKVGAAKSVTESLISNPAKALLVLLDPVDSPKASALQAVMSSLQVIQNRDRSQFAKSLQKPDNSGTDTITISDQTKGFAHTIWPWPVLIISTPFGGSSKYYRVPYESACAPVSRNGDAFAKAFICSSVNQGFPLSTDSSTSQSILPPSVIYENKESDEKCSVGDEEVPRRRVLHVKLPDVGHTQMLRSRKKSTFGSVCASNELIPDSTVQEFVSCITRLWVNMSINTQTSDENQYQVEIKGIKNGISRIFPSLKTEWIS